MRSIHNFTIQTRGITKLSMPKGAEPMQAMAVRDEIILFAILDPQERDSEMREFHVFFSGFSVPESNTDEDYRYLGTAIKDGFAPIHVFERVAIENDAKAQVPE